MTTLSDNLLIRLQNADVVCKDCGDKYGRYSVGCSSTWVGECNVCEETKPVTEVRDYGYLAKGIADEKERLRGQSAEVANYIASQEEDGPAWERGEIACMFTEDEIGFLNECLDTLQEFHGTLQPGSFVKEDVDLFESIEQKITTLYDDYCVKYELSPALIAYNKKYGTWGTGEDEARWEGFRDAFMMLEGGK